MNQVRDVLAGRRDEAELSLATRWLRDAVRGLDSEFGWLELFAEQESIGVAVWYSEDYSDWGNLLPRLASASAGALPLEAVEVTELKTSNGDEFIELSCMVRGQRRYLCLPWCKYGRQTELLVELNRWIADSSRRFASVHEHFVCVDSDQETQLAERGWRPYVPTTWELDPNDLVPLAMHLAAERDDPRLLDVTGFNETLWDDAPELLYFRGVALLATGDAAEGLAAMRNAASKGSESARAHLAESPED